MLREICGLRAARRANCSYERNAWLEMKPTKNSRKQWERKIVPRWYQMSSQTQPGQLYSGLITVKWTYQSSLLLLKKSAWWHTHVTVLFCINISTETRVMAHRTPLQSVATDFTEREHEHRLCYSGLCSQHQKTNTSKRHCECCWSVLATT